MNARNELLTQIAKIIIVEVCCHQRGAATSESAIKAAGEIISAIEAVGYVVVPMADLQRIADHHPETLGLYHGQNFKLLAESAAGCAKLMIEAATKG